MISSVIYRIGKCHATIAVALALAFVASVPVRAATPPFGIKISEKEYKLEFPTDASWESFFEGDLGYQRMIARSMPFIEITNTGTDPITEFHLSIANEQITCIPSVSCTGGSRFDFAPVQGSNFAVVGQTAPLPSGVTLTSTTNSARDELILNLGGQGLAAGEMFRFKVNLDVDASFAAHYANLFGASQPDFRTVFFDMNRKNVYDNDLVQSVQDAASDNAKAWVVLDPDEGEEITSDPIVFEDPTVDPEVASIINNRLRSGCCCESDPVLIFIPEPGSACLVFVAAACGLLWRSRRVVSAA